MSLALPHQFNTTHSLNLPHLVNSSHLSVTKAPDIIRTSRFYGAEDDGLEITHCRAAFNSLPTGNVPVVYRPLKPYGSRDELPNLIVVKTIGTCQLRFFVSGQWAERSEFAVNIVPNDIRDMFGDLITALDSSGYGGFATKHLARTIDWLSSPDIIFPQIPTPPYMRKSPPSLSATFLSTYNPLMFHRANLSGALASSITFLTAMIWDSGHEAAFFDPGANSPSIAATLRDSLKKAREGALRREGRGSPLGQLLGPRIDFLNTVVRTSFNQGRPYWTWWGNRRLEASTATLGNLTSGGWSAITQLESNITSAPSELNVTVLDFRNDKDATE